MEVVGQVAQLRLHGYVHRVRHADDLPRLLKVLRNLGDYNPPVMIDAVMGVLDEESRDVLMEEYFPGLADQTILLCTTSEIRKDKDYPKLEPFVSRTYPLMRDVELQSTHVEEGYFGTPLND